MEFLILEFHTTATGYNVVAVRGIHNTVRRDERYGEGFEILFIDPLLSSTYRVNMSYTPN
jgi:hypothetical protein